MKFNAEIQVRITDHAYEQYCDRVRVINKNQLITLCKEQLQAKDYEYCKRDFLHLSGVWWVFEMRERMMIMITCYGKSHILIPSAVAWAKRNNDNIRLSDT